MLNKKKILYIITAAVIVLGTGCSNSTNKGNLSSKSVQSENIKVEDKKNSEEVGRTTKEEISDEVSSILKELGSDNIEIDEYISKWYEEMKKDLEENGDPYDKHIRIKNIPIFRLLNQKAKNACTESFYIEESNTETINNLKNSRVKMYCQEGNSRREYYKDGKLTYLLIYNKAEDTMYNYDVKKDTLNKVTKFTKKNKGYYPYQNGYFVIINGLQGNIKVTEYEGKKVVYDELDGRGIKDRYWYDAETGILLKDQQIQLENGKEIANYQTERTIEFNKDFDKSLFQFDKNNLQK